MNYHRNTKGTAVSSDAIRGLIIKDMALLDFQLNLLLSLYFGPNERAMEFYEKIAQQTSFSRKTEILKSILKDKKIKSSQVIEFLGKISKIRNYLAHIHFYDDRHKVFKNDQIVKLLDN